MHKTFNNKNIKPFSRLEITDRNGKTLVSTINVFDLYLQSSRMQNPIEDINKINKIIPNTIKDKQKILLKLKERKHNGKIVFIKQGITAQQKQELLDIGVEGLWFETSEKRFYHSSSMNSITGYCPSMGLCISGIEKSMNSYLKTTYNEPLKLSIDSSAQTLLHNILQKRMIETNSKGAVGLIMKVKTGEIISAISLPDCDFNNYSTCSNDALFNRYSFGIYELGSVFKLFLAATALQADISPYKQYKRESYQLDTYTIHDIDKKEQKGGSLNLIDIIRLSSNVGCAKVMEDINLKDQYIFLTNLGLLQKLNTELPELGKPIYPKRWTFVNGVTISYGHGIAVSPLHYITAVASLLNNSFVRPTFLATNEIERQPYKYLSPEKYELFKDIMRNVVSSGAGKNAYIDQYDVGGKTGTAIQLENGKYNRHSMILSFVAGVPMNEPEYVFFLMLDRPKTDANNNNIIRASNILGSTMNYAISTIGPILNIKPINK